MPILPAREMNLLKAFVHREVAAHHSSEPLEDFVVEKVVEWLAERYFLGSEARRLWELG